MNAQAHPVVALSEEGRTMTIEGPNSDAQQSQDNEPDPNQDKVEPMEMTLEAPTLDTPVLDAIDVSLDLPSPVVVSIKPPVPKVVQRTTQARRSSQSSDANNHGPRDSYNNQQPNYPSRERDLGIEALVSMRLLINESGAVENIQFIDGPESFRREVNDVIWRWQFEPAMRNGQPFKTWVVKNFRFTITGVR